MAGVEHDLERAASNRRHVDDSQHGRQMAAIGIVDRASCPSESQLAQRNSRFCQRSSIARPCAGLSTMPARWKNFSPLYLGGLCEAEIWMPPAAPSSRTSQPIVGVAVGPAKRTSCPVAVMLDSTAAAKTGGRNPSIVAEHDRPWLAPAGIGRRELDSHRRIEPVAHHASKTRDAGDPGSRSSPLRLLPWGCPAGTTR